MCSEGVVKISDVERSTLGTVSVFSFGQTQMRQNEMSLLTRHTLCQLREGENKKAKKVTKSAVKLARNMHLSFTKEKSNTKRNKQTKTHIAVTTKAKAFFLNKIHATVNQNAR